MKQLLHVLADGLRSFVFLKPRPDAFAAPLPVHLATYLLYLFAMAGFESAFSAAPLTFDAAGVSGAVAAICISLLLLSLLPLRPREAPPERVVLGAAAASLPTLVLAALSNYLFVHLTGMSLVEAGMAGHWLPATLLGAMVAWSFLAIFRLIYGMANRQRALLAFAGVCLMTLSTLILPNAGMIKGRDAESFEVSLLQMAVDALRPKTETAARGPELPSIDGEALMMGQHALVAKSVASLQASRQGQPELYFVGFAPYSWQDVFKREVKAVKALFDERFGTSGRSIILQNHRESMEDLPLASISNLKTVLGAIGSRMDRERDVLVLFATSHGYPNAISVSMEGVRLNNLTPARLADALDNAGIKNRVLILSACYSGSFMEPLSDDNTLIVTAARADRTSFGCSNEREWTYFGDAFFNQALREERSLVSAYERARSLVEGWEKQKGLEPSEPQIFIGKSIREKVDAILAARLAGAG